jgi:hypothetical protein
MDPTFLRWLYHKTKVHTLCNREKNEDKKLESKSISSPIRNLGAVHHKIHAQVA